MCLLAGLSLDVDPSNPTEIENDFGVLFELCRVEIAHSAATAGI